MSAAEQCVHEQMRREAADLIEHGVFVAKLLHRLGYETEARIQHEIVAAYARLTLGSER